MHSEEKKSLFRQFQFALAELGGKAFPVLPGKVGEMVANIIENQSAKAIVGYNSAYLKSLELEESLKKLAISPFYWLPASRPGNFDERSYRRRLAAADLAITSADYLVAATATLVFRGNNNPSRLITLLPPSLLVIASVASLQPDLETFHSRLKASGSEGNDSLVYFSGPSRTADIEKILVLGVHGPKALTVLVVEDSEG